MRRILIGLLPVVMTAAVIGVFGGTTVAHAAPSDLPVPGVVCNGPAGAHNPLCPNGPPGPPSFICDLPGVAAHNPHCPPPPPPPPGEDVCETGGLLAPETIADQLVDAGIPLHEPEADGPISSALVGSQLEATPLAPVVNEVACAVNLLTL